SIVSLVIAPTLAQLSSHDIGHLQGQMENPAGTFEEGKSPVGVQADDTVNDYSAFLSALETDGYFTDETATISVVGNRVVIDSKPLDEDVSNKYIPLLNGMTNIELDFTEE
nr:hypothetical protein [Bacteroidota bacterium]